MMWDGRVGDGEGEGLYDYLLPGIHIPHRPPHPHNLLFAKKGVMVVKQPRDTKQKVKPIYQTHRSLSPPQTEKPPPINLQFLRPQLSVREYGVWGMG